MNIIACDIHPVQNLRVQLKHSDDPKERQEWAKHFITLGFVAFEDLLKKHSGLYCFGDQVTLADVYLVPQCYNADRFGVDMSAFPHISAVRANLAKLDAFIKAEPNQQPDAIV